MTTDLARALLAQIGDVSGASVVYGVASGLNTVSLEGAATAVTLPALSPVIAGDYCAVLVQGADRVILGRLNSPALHTVANSSVLTSSGSPPAFTIPFGITFQGPPIVVVMNGDVNTGANALQIAARYSDSAVVRGYYLDGIPTPVSGTHRFDWIAVGVR